MMKNFLLIDSGFFLKFWAKAINIVNYLQNQLLIKNKRREIILKKIYIKKKKDISYIKIFSSIVNMLISQKKTLIKHLQEVKRNFY